MRDESPVPGDRALVHALGEMRSHAAVPKLLALADVGDAATRQAALLALADIGDPAAGPALSKTRVPAPYRERSQAPAWPGTPQSLKTWW